MIKYISRALVLGHSVSALGLALQIIGCYVSFVASDLLVLECEGLP